MTVSAPGPWCCSTAEEPDLIRHGIEPPVVPGPEEAAPAEDSAPDDGPEGWEIGIIGGVDIADPDAVGPATLDVWTRFAGAPDDPAIGRALLAFASDGFLIGTAMRPHAGVGQAQAHHTLSTGVVSHTITFHEPFSAGDWLLLAHSSPYAGHGRGYGRADVFRRDGAAGGVLRAGQHDPTHARGVAGRALRSAAEPFDSRTWAIESANGLGYLLSQQLVTAGETVLDVPATLASRTRLLATGRPNKNDPNDATSVAIAGTAPSMACARWSRSGTPRCFGRGRLPVLEFS